MTTAIKQTTKTTTTTNSSSASAKREQRLEDISSQREQLIQQRQKDAAASKARTLQMYDNMAKSGSAGDHKPLDINTYRGKESGKLLLSGAAIQKTDLVEETIRERVRASEENKKRLLAAYDYAVKTQPAGTVRDVDFATFKGIDGKFKRSTCIRAHKSLTPEVASQIGRPAHRLDLSSNMRVIHNMNHLKCPDLNKINQLAQPHFVCQTVSQVW